MNTLTINYDDSSLYIIEKVNDLLKNYGMKFVDDNVNADGEYVNYTLQIKQEKNIYINASLQLVYEDSLSYDEIVRLAYKDIKDTSGFTVVYSQRGEDNGGSLIPGQFVEIQNNMIFSAFITNLA